MSSGSPRLAFAVLTVAAVMLLAPAAAREVDPWPLAFSAPFGGGTQQDAASWDSANWDAAQWDGAQWDGAQWDGATWDGAQWDGSQWDGAQWDASRWDGSNWDASNWDASNWDASRWDAGSFDGVDPLYPYQWGLRAVNAPGAWSLMGPGDGSKVICVADSGVDYTHPDLAGRMWTDAYGVMGHDFVDDDSDPMDVGGHGTHVASIAAGRAGDANGVAGVAHALVMAVRVIGPDGFGTDEDLVNGIRWCVDNGADIVSLSLSTVEDVKLVASAVNYAAMQGALVVGSGGNQRCDDCHSPLLKLRGVLTITAVAPDGNVAPFTTWGPNVDLGAPGVAIPGAIPGGRYALASGSSQAVPHVSGAAALVWQRNPGLSAGDVADILRQSAQSVSTPEGPIPVLDVDAAVRLATNRETGKPTDAVDVNPADPSVEADPSTLPLPKTEGSLASSTAQTPLATGGATQRILSPGPPL